MSRLSRTATLFAASALAAAAALPAAAATVTEVTDYSSSASNPTVISTAYDSLSGSLTGGDNDQLAIALDASSTAISLVFSIADTSYGNNASYTILYSYSPFVTQWYSNSAETNQWGNPVAYNVQTTLADTTVTAVWNSNSTYSYSIPVDLTLGATLYLSIISNGAANGGVVNYTVSGFGAAAAATTAARGTADDSTSPVPLPAGIVLLGSAIGLGGLVASRRKRA